MYVMSVAALYARTAKVTETEAMWPPKAENIYNLPLYREICQLLPYTLLRSLKIIL